MKSKYMNGLFFSKARYMIGVGFKILARTPVPNYPRVTPTRETPKGVFWQSVKTLMECHKGRHFIRVCTVCFDKYDFQGLEYIIF